MGQTCCVIQRSESMHTISIKGSLQQIKEFQEIQPQSTLQIRPCPTRQVTLTQFHYRIADDENDFAGFEEQFQVALHKTATFATHQLGMSIHQPHKDSSTHDELNLMQTLGAPQTRETSKHPTFTMDMNFLKLKGAQDQQQSNIVPMATQQQQDQIQRAKTPAANKRLSRSLSSNNIKVAVQARKEAPKQGQKQQDQQQDECRSLISQISQNTKKGILKKRTQKTPPNGPNSKAPVKQFTRSISMFDDKKDDASVGTANVSKKQVKFDPKIFRPKNKNFYM